MGTVVSMTSAELLDEDTLKVFMEQEIALLELQDILNIMFSLEFYMAKCDELDTYMDTFLGACTCGAKEL